MIRGSISIVTTLAQYKLKAEHLALTLDERVRQFEKREIEVEVSYYGGGVAGNKESGKGIWNFTCNSVQ